MLQLRRFAPIFAVALAVFAESSGADARPAKVSANAKSADGAQSVGAPNAGKLRGAARLKGSRTLRQRKDAHSWALPQMVHLLQYAAGHVAKKHKNAVLLLGDLSGRTGGPLEGHNSHQSGRDADVGFFVMNSKGKPVNVQHFVAFDGSGKGRDLPWANFDEARNWALIEALLTYDKANVRSLFITAGLRAKLLAYAARKKVSKEILTRAAAVMMSGGDADLHDDHVHVRIACPETMRDVCVEEATAHGPAAKSSGDATDEKKGEAAAAH